MDLPTESYPPIHSPFSTQLEASSCLGAAMELNYSENDKEVCRDTANPPSHHIVWGFMLENTYFMEFDACNHTVIESAYRQRRLRPTSHYITLKDSHLSYPAKIYFGVAQVHLRMPGTRYYVKRRVLKTPTHTPFSLTSPWMALPTPSPEPLLPAPTLTPPVLGEDGTDPCIKTCADVLLDPYADSCRPICTTPCANPTYPPFFMDPSLEAILWNHPMNWPPFPHTTLQMAMPPTHSQWPLSVYTPSPLDSQDLLFPLPTDTSTDRLSWEQWLTVTGDVSPPSMYSSYPSLPY